MNSPTRAAKVVLYLCASTLSILCTNAWMCCRSFMQERLLSAQAGTAGKLGQAVLYFGCRRSDQDYLYGSLLEDWAKSGHLTLFTAFSRQQVTTVSLIACSVSKQCSEGMSG